MRFPLPRPPGEPTLDLLDGNLGLDAELSSADVAKLLSLVDRLLAAEKRNERMRERLLALRATIDSMLAEVTP